VLLRPDLHTLRADLAAYESSFTTRLRRRGARTLEIGIIPADLSDTLTLSRILFRDRGISRRRASDCRDGRSDYLVVGRPVQPLQACLVDPKTARK
jgi:hypothetical protein